MDLRNYKTYEKVTSVEDLGCPWSLVQSNGTLA